MAKPKSKVEAFFKGVTRQLVLAFCVVGGAAFFTFYYHEFLKTSEYLEGTALIKFIENNSLELYGYELPEVMGAIFGLLLALVVAYYTSGRSKRMTLADIKEQSGGEESPEETARKTLAEEGKQEGVVGDKGDTPWFEG